MTCRCSQRANRAERRHTRSESKGAKPQGMVWGRALLEFRALEMRRGGMLRWSGRSSSSSSSSRRGRRKRKEGRRVKHHDHHHLQHREESNRGEWCLGARTGLSAARHGGGAACGERRVSHGGRSLTSHAVTARRTRLQQVPRIPRRPVVVVVRQLAREGDRSLLQLRHRSASSFQGAASFQCAASLQGAASFQGVASSRSSHRRPNDADPPRRWRRGLPLRAMV